nr:hypothetical protein [Bacteroidota bacterium]
MKELNTLTKKSTAWPTRDPIPLPVIKVMAFLFPLFVMYGPYNDDIEKPPSRDVWKYLAGGLFFYLTIALFIAFS